MIKFDNSQNKDGLKHQKKKSRSTVKILVITDGPRSLAWSLGFPVSTTLFDFKHYSDIRDHRLQGQKGHSDGCEFSVNYPQLSPRPRLLGTRAAHKKSLKI